MKPAQLCFLLAVIGASIFLLVQKDHVAMLTLMIVILGILLFFSLVWRGMEIKQHPMAQEIKERTITWWWMVAIFMLALATHRIVSFSFLGFLCFASLREYFSLLPMQDQSHKMELSFNDRLPVFFCYMSIPLVLYVAYIEWYNLFIILVPVYIFLLIPILLVLQNRAEGTMRSLGIISLGFMFFIYNLGHCLFMINMGPMVLLYCFTLTEIRDLLSFWIGKIQAKIAAGMQDGRLKEVLEKRIAPDVSPKKTWSAGIAAALVTSLFSLALVPLLPEFPHGKLTYGYSAMIGFMIGILGLFGDLVFSMVKRDSGIKDSGNILPGHGGIIDRVDSLVFTIPITFHLIRWAYF